MSFVIGWLAVMFPLVFSPGPANIVFAVSGARVGVRSSIPLLVGVDVVFIVKSILIGFGFGTLFQLYPKLLLVLQLTGAIYLIWLSWCFLKSSTSLNESQSKSLGFRDGLTIQLLNAKGWLLVILMFSLFTESAVAYLGELGIVALVVMLAVLNISMHLVWIWLGSVIVKSLSHAYSEKWMNGFFSMCLLGVSIWLIFDGFTSLV